MREPIVINAETREITVPETERAFGVAGERKVEVKHIRIEGRTVDGTDLTQGFSWKVSCENAGQELCADLIDGIVADAGNIEFDWIVGAAPMAYKGTMHFAVCAVRVDAAGNILQEWHSKMGAGDVANGIEATVQNIGGQDLLAHIQSITAAAQQNAAAAQQNAAAAQRDAAAAAKGAEDAVNSAGAAAKNATAAKKSEDNAASSASAASDSAKSASDNASAAAASKAAAKASADKAQTLVDGIPDDYATALKDISRLKENKLDKPNNPVVGQLLRVKSISDTGEITLETVADNDDNKLPTGGSTGQVLAKSTNSDYDVGWVDQTDALPDGGASGQVLTKNSSASGDASWKTPATPSNPLPTGGTSGQVLAKSTNSDYDVGWVDQTGGSGILPSDGYPGAYLRKKSISDYDTEWVTRPFESKKVWTNTDLSSGKFLPDSLVIIGNTIEKFNRIVSDYTLCYTDAKDISASYGSEKRMYTLTIPYDFESEYTFIMQTARGYRYVSIDNEGSYGLVFSVGFNTQTNAQDNSVAIPYAIYAVVESVNRDD